MSLAAVDLQSKNMKIIDVAGKYGYHSPTAFNRAFQSVHGISPSAVKNEGVSVKSFPPISFIITVKGVEEMNYRIETKDAFRIVGTSALVMIRNHGGIILRYLLHRPGMTLKNMLCRRLPGQ